MSNLFVFLLLISIVALIIGLIQPKVFSKLFKTRTNRKTEGIVFGIAIVLFFILIGVTAPPATKNTKPVKTETAPTTTANAETPKTAEPPKLTYREAANWNKSGQTWRAIVFSEKPSNEELIKVAKELHSKNKTDYYSFFDNDEKLEEFKNWDINYALTTSTTAYPYPEEWVKAHELAMMNEMNNEGWQLTSTTTFEAIYKF